MIRTEEVRSIKFNNRLLKHHLNRLLKHHLEILLKPHKKIEFRVIGTEHGANSNEF